MEIGLIHRIGKLKRTVAHVPVYDMNQAKLYIERSVTTASFGTNLFLVNLVFYRMI